MISIAESEDLELFLTFPAKTIYKDDPFYVQQLLDEEKKLLDSKNNPFYKNAKRKLFLAYKNGKIAGRIAAVVNYRHNQMHNDKVGFFGFFESIEDLDVARDLFKAAEDYLSKEGLDRIRGPISPSMNDVSGLLVKGFFAEPVFMMPYNKAYYMDLIEQNGFKKVKDLFAFYLSVGNKPKEKLKRLSLYAQKKFSIQLRSFSKKNFENDLRVIHKLYCEAWKDNWGFVPPTFEEFYYGTKDFKTMVPEELIIIAQKDGHPCGFSAIIPDFNQALKGMGGKITPFNAFKLIYRLKKIDNYRLITLGVLPECRKLGVDLLLYVKSFEVVEKRGGKGGELSWTLEDNEAINKPILKMGAEHYKTYRIYEKEITPH
ncbi:hypothetical protein [Hippea maritima]|uniref:N-acetyltransferase domain-containing protein n=1 Tax=Hippea maritima (strain ATCC 700847 / DSM 10411 / MH2) TaxID=760142 RepID=F2LUN6_HIPMA|nr:hypothetical protein [Hippea maritima]AEA34626.1 hypothetical protein Hipma_1681 [Hippea maritima DSM 10411]